MLSDDPNTVGDIEYKQVLQTFAHDTTSFVDVYIGGEKITTTEEHPFWVPDVGWLAAKDLHAGSHLQTKYESWLDVDKVELHGGLATVYNFKVEGFYTYFVSDLGLLVHNNNCSYSDLSSKYRRYLRDIENQTGLEVPQNQRAVLMDDLRNNSYSKLSKVDPTRHRSQFNNAKNDLITEW